MPQTVSPSCYPKACFCEGRNYLKTSAMATGQRMRCDCLSAKVRGCVSGFLTRYAIFACRRPWASLLLSFLFVLVCAPGFAFLKNEIEEVNNAIIGSYSVKSYLKNKREYSFNPGTTGVFLYFTAKDGKNLFSQQALEEIGKAVDKVLAWKTPAGEGVYDMCVNSWRGKCEFSSVFHNLEDQGSKLGVNMTRPRSSSLGSVEFMAKQVGIFCRDDPKLCRSFLEPQQKFVIVVKNMDETGPVQVESLVVIIYLDPEKSDSSGEKSYTEYQKKALEEIHGPTYEADKDNLQTDNFYVISFSQAGVNQEGSRPSTNESHLMAITFVVMIVFVGCSIVSPVTPRSRVLLSMSCMLVVILALACALGLSAYVTVPFTPMTTLVIFTLFGVSVDDIIVMVHSYERTDSSKSIEERIADSLQESGTAITLTSATSLVAFMCAATCPVPNIRYFCVTASFGILGIYILQITFFLPLFIMDERRRAAKRKECCCSMCFGLSAEPEKSESDRNKATLGSRVRQCIFAPSVGGGCGVMEKYAKLVSYNHFAMMTIVVVFALMTGLAIFGSAHADTEADLTDYYIDSSFMKKYFRMTKELWSSSRPVHMHIEHQGEGLFSESRRAEIDGMYNDLAALDWTSGPEFHWLRDFDKWLNLTSTSPADLQATRATLQGNPTAFGAKVAEFLDVLQVTVPGKDVPIEPWRYKKDVVLQDGQVKRSRLEMQYEFSLAVQARYINNWRKTYELFFPDGHPDDISEGGRVKNVWVSNALSMAAERDAKIKFIIFSNLGIACAAVAGTVMIMLNPLVGLFVGILVLALDAMVLALLTAYGVKLDFVAFLCLSMTIGLVVDYATHTSHAYMHYEGEPNDKLYHSIRAMGASVLSGGGSTVLGISVLACASSKGFRSFFYVLGTAIFMGTAVGITVSPVLLRCLHGAGLCLWSFVRPRKENDTPSNVVPSTFGSDHAVIQA